MKTINFEDRTFRWLGYQIDARDFYTFSERWLFRLITNLWDFILIIFYGAGLLGLALQ